MGRTKRKVEVAYLDAHKLELLKQLAAQTRIARSVLVREAVDDLLVKYGFIEVAAPVVPIAPAARRVSPARGSRRTVVAGRARKSRKL
jgi:histidyl-tRNA synthetase